MPIGDDKEELEALREREGERLEQLIESVWSDALAGDSKAAKTALDAIRARCDLHGLNAPKKISSEAFVRTRNELPLPFDLSKLSVDDLETLNGLIKKYS